MPELPDPPPAPKGDVSALCAAWMQHGGILRDMAEAAMEKAARLEEELAECRAAKMAVAHHNTALAAALRQYDDASPLLCLRETKERGRVRSQARRLAGRKQP